MATVSPGSGSGLWWQCAEVTGPRRSAWGCPGLGWHSTGSRAHLADPCGRRVPWPSPAGEEAAPLWRWADVCGPGLGSVSGLLSTRHDAGVGRGTTGNRCTSDPEARRPSSAPLGRPQGLYVRRTAQRGEVSWPSATVSHLNLYANSGCLRSPGCAAVEGFFRMNLF